MTSVERLLTLVDLDGHDPGPNARSMSVRARHEAVLTDGRHVLLLDDRGWTATRHTAFLDGTPSEDDRRRAALEGRSVWADQTVEDMEDDARSVVGPDEPYRSYTREDMETGHWGRISSILRDYGVEITGPELMALRHDVELSDRVLARIGHRRRASD